MKLKKKSGAMQLHDDRTHQKEKRRNDEAYRDELRVGTIFERNISSMWNHLFIYCLISEKG
jgi:uncharacterized SAM-dependent methyltransferase